MLTACVIVISCSRSVAPDLLDEKYAEPAYSGSVIPVMIQFGIDKVYHYKIRIDTNYMKSEGFFVSAKFSLGDKVVEMELYDDGISDDSLRNDLAASNNIWSGGINSYDFLAEGDWVLTVTTNLYDRKLDDFYYDKTVRIRANTAPVIEEVDGIFHGDTLKSGFPTFPITVKVEDPDNDSQGINDNQILDLKIINDISSKTFSYERESPMADFVIFADSTFASGLKGLYSFEFTATDMYGETDILIIDDIYIENGAPSLYNLVYPDTVYLPHSGEDPVTFGVEVNVNDPQGHLESQDIDAVVFRIPSLSYTGIMRDNGSSASGDRIKDDGIYTISFQVGSSNQEAVYPFEITARDKVNNLSPVLEGVLIFVREELKYSKRSGNENLYIYPDPFLGSR